MKKGLLLIPYLEGYGGTETVINNLLLEYEHNNQNKIYINTYSLGGTKNDYWLNHKNVKIFNFPKNSIFRKLLYIFVLPILILYILKKEDPKFVISTNPIIWYLSKVISKFLKRKINVIAWYHYSFKLKPIKKFLLYKPDYYFVISSAGKDELINMNIKNKSIFVIYNPVIPTNKTIKMSKNHNVFIYVGRTEYYGYKNISELFFALSKLKNHNWLLLNYGVGSDKEKLVELSIKLKIYNNIKWMGFQNNVFDHIDKADALILTSKSEGFSMVITEAISHGVYVISSDCPVGPPEIINDNNGTLYKLGNLDDLANSILNIIKTDKEFDHDKIKNSISDLYISNYFNRLIKYLDILNN